ncbi:hypothetical protein ACWDZ8_39160 [Streptomyces sp. NPDC003233]
MVCVPGSAAGSLTQIDPTTPRTLRAVATSAPCTASGLQATARHCVYQGGIA